MPSITTVMKSGLEIIAPAVETVTPSPVIDGPSTKGAFYTNDMEMITRFTDLQGLFNATNPNPPQGYGAFDDQDCIEPDADCDFCKSYNGEKATTVFALKDNFTGNIEIVYLCDDCINEESVFANKEVLRQTKI